ncbi:hypothetical protein AVEN_87154-1 [Araneus ventricosus]|uniref:Secreted protein n=1 Tax=Araneus ventricosus TaxID=182803 RepID=A0A4Y2GXU9_ARAVE|nr:hypothetical protein AVEN_87154-1 [Araneus ventricosus]
MFHFDFARGSKIMIPLLGFCVVLKRVKAVEDGEDLVSCTSNHSWEQKQRIVLMLGSNILKYLKLAFEVGRRTHIRIGIRGTETG